jgi:hypothetical protein
MLEFRKYFTTLESDIHFESQPCSSSIEPSSCTTLLSLTQLTHLALISWWRFLGGVFANLARRSIFPRLPFVVASKFSIPGNSH